MLIIHRSRENPNRLIVDWGEEGTKAPWEMKCKVKDLPHFLIEKVSNNKLEARMYSSTLEMLNMDVRRSLWWQETYEGTYFWMNVWEGCWPKRLS